MRKGISEEALQRLASALRIPVGAERDASVKPHKFNTVVDEPVPATMVDDFTVEIPLPLKKDSICQAPSGNLYVVVEDRMEGPWRTAGDIPVSVYCVSLEEDEGGKQAGIEDALEESIQEAPDLGLEEAPGAGIEDGSKGKTIRAQIQWDIPREFVQTWDDHLAPENLEEPMGDDAEFIYVLEYFDLDAYSIDRGLMDIMRDLPKTGRRFSR